jgi:Holliday junction DNA helicase RuvB
MSIIGQESTLSQIEVAISSAKKRNMAPPHMMFSGHAGCGKTSMAKEVAKMLGTDFITVIPESIKDQKSVMELLDSLNYEGYNDEGDRIGDIKPTVVFFDECHNLPMYAQEKLGIVMENFTMESGESNKVFWLPYFTVICATTLAGELSKPFLDRFKHNYFFEPYNVADSVQILNYHANRLKLPITARAARDIARRSRGVPRIIVRYLERCGEVMDHKKSLMITSGLTLETFKTMEIDEAGFNKIELKILTTLYNSEKPIGLETLSIVTGESAKTIKNDLETYLTRNELIVRSGSGRVITAKGRSYLEEKGYVGKRQGRVAISPTRVRK